MKTKDVAEYLKISTQQVRRLANKGELPCIRLSERILRFRLEDVQEYVNRKAG